MTQTGYAVLTGLFFVVVVMPLVIGIAVGKKLKGKDKGKE